MLSLALVALLLGPTPSPTTAPQLRAVQYTTAAQHLYVDPIGNDANACTSPGAAACLTIPGALGKSPKYLRHSLLVTLAPGLAYAGAVVSGFVIEGGGSILFDGALTNSTLTTGTASGTATSGTAGSSVVYGTLSDTTQGWTTDNLRGRYVTITGGAGSGQVRMITTNTATSFTVAGLWTTPTAGSTYVIQDPSVAVTTPVPATTTGLGATGLASAAFQIFGNSIYSGRIAFRNIKVETAVVSFIVDGPGAVDLLQVTASTTSALSGMSVTNRGSLTLTTCFILTAQNVPVVATGSNINVATSLIRITTPAGTFGGVTANGMARADVRTSQFQNTGGLFLVDGSSGLFTGRVDCGSLATSSGLYVGGGSLFTSSDGNTSLILSSAGYDVQNCVNGIHATGGATVAFSTSLPFTGAVTGYALQIVYGAQVQSPTTTPTITAGIAQISLDNGAMTGSFSQLGARFECLTNLATGSKVCRI